ncbi:phosphoribosyltransferase family protein [Flavobacteriales bacterium]|nr:phosphoribosyltransferase family protein [Flavobacteriales bacterium]
MAKGTEHLPSLLQAIKECREVRFRHTSFLDESESERLLHPYLLKEYRNRWYVIGKDADVVAGVATGAIAVGLMVAEELGLPFIYVRPKPKEHGLGNQIEGYLPENSKVVVIEDLISTGGSSLKAVEALRETTSEVLGMMAIFTYGFANADENFENVNCEIYTLSNYSELVKLAVGSGYVSVEDLEQLNEWRKSPSTWNT